MASLRLTWPTTSYVGVLIAMFSISDPAEALTLYFVSMRRTWGRSCMYSLLKYPGFSLTLNPNPNLTPGLDFNLLKIMLFMSDEGKN